MSVRDARAGGLVRRLFAMLTARLEDAAETAVRGQSPGVTAEQAAFLVDRLLSLAEDVLTLSAAVGRLSSRQRGELL